jgi:hypothetical protein
MPMGGEASADVENTVGVMMREKQSSAAMNFLNKKTPPNAKFRFLTLKYITF